MSRRNLTVFSQVTALAVAITIFMVTFLFELAFGGNEADGKLLPVQEGKEVVFADNSVLRLIEDYSEKNEVNYNNGVLTLSPGEYFGNFSYSEMKTNIYLDDIVLIPERAVFDLKYNGNQLDLMVFEGNVYAGFLDSDFGDGKILDKFSPTFLNRLLIPKDTSVSINLNNLKQYLDVLLYTKLAKEFKYSPIPAEVYEDTTIKENLKRVNDFNSDVKNERASRILAYGGTFQNSLLDRVVFQLANNLTLIPEKKLLEFKKFIKDHLDSALFYYTSGDDDAAADYLASLDLVLDGDTRKILKSYFEETSFFIPGDKEYPVFLYLLDKVFEDPELKISAVEYLFEDVYLAMGKSELLSYQAINRYFEYLIRSFSELKDDENFLLYVTYNNQLFDTLMLRRAVFYQDGFFAMKSRIEAELLSLYVDGQVRQELIQSFISTKIDFLKRLRRFYFDGYLDTAQARQIFARIIKEVDALMPNDSEMKLAVNQLFESQLNDVGDFWGYLNSLEYHSSIYGSTDEERYKFYLKEKKEIWSFVNVQSDVLGKKSKFVPSKNDVKKEIFEFFSQFDDYVDILVEDVPDVSARFLSIEGVVGGYPFKAEFDRDYGALKNIYVYDKLIAEEKVKAENVLKLIQAEFADIKTEELNNGFNQETNAEIVAKKYVLSLVVAAGFEVDFAQISVVDKENVIYRVNNAKMAENNLEVSFDYYASGEIVKNVFITDGGDEPVVLKGEYTLEELVAAVGAE